MLSNKLFKTYIVELPLNVKNINIDELYTNNLETEAEDTTRKLHKLEENDEFKVYTVKAGDKLSNIAVKLNVTIANLEHWNKLKNNNVKVGQKLKYISDISE